MKICRVNLSFLRSSPPSYTPSLKKDDMRGTYFILHSRLWARQYTWAGYTHRGSAHSRCSVPTIATALPLPANAFRSRCRQYPVRRRLGYAPLPRMLHFLPRCRGKRPARLRLRNHPYRIIPISSGCFLFENQRPVQMLTTLRRQIAASFPDLRSNGRCTTLPATSILEVVPI